MALLDFARIATLGFQRELSLATDEAARAEDIAAHETPADDAASDVSLLLALAC